MQVARIPWKDEIADIQNLCLPAKTMNTVTNFAQYFFFIICINIMKYNREILSYF